MKLYKNYRNRTVTHIFYQKFKNSKLNVVASILKSRDATCSCPNIATRILQPLPPFPTERTLWSPTSPSATSSSQTKRESIIVVREIGTDAMLHQTCFSIPCFTHRNITTMQLSERFHISEWMLTRGWTSHCTVTVSPVCFENEQTSHWNWSGVLQEWEVARLIWVWAEEVWRWRKGGLYVPGWRLHMQEGVAPAGWLGRWPLHGLTAPNLSDAAASNMGRIARSFATSIFDYREKFFFFSCALLEVLCHL